MMSKVSYTFLIVLAENVQDAAFLQVGRQSLVGTLVRTGCSHGIYVSF